MFLQHEQNWRHKSKEIQQFQCLRKHEKAFKNFVFIFFRGGEEKIKRDEWKTNILNKDFEIILMRARGDGAPRSHPAITTFFHWITAFPWSSLAEGDEGGIGASGKLLCLWETRKKYAAHVWHHSTHVGLLGQSRCSSPSTKEPLSNLEAPKNSV